MPIRECESTTAGEIQAMVRGRPVVARQLWEEVIGKISAGKRCLGSNA